MRIYLTGPAGPDQLATKWLLQERGYHVVCTTDIASPRYEHNKCGIPTAVQLKKNRIYEMLLADAVVLSEDLAAADGYAAVQMCRFGGIPAILYDLLPAQAPHHSRVQELVDELDVTVGEQELLSDRLKRHAKEARRRMEVWARRFDERWGWFFTNGNKANAQAAQRTYKNTIRTTTTA